MIANPKNDATASCDTEDALCSDHRIPANTYTWRMRTSCPSFTDCLHEMSVPTSCGCTPGPSSCPTQLSVDLAVFQQCTGCLLCKLRKSAKWYPWLATIGIFPWENDMILNPKNDAPASCDTGEARCSLFRPSKTTNTFYSDTPLVVRCQIGRLAHSDLLLFRNLNSKSPCCQVSHHRSDLDITRRCGHEIRVWAEVLELPRGAAKWYLWLATMSLGILLEKTVPNPKNDATASCDTGGACIFARRSLFCTDHRQSSNTYTWRMGTSCPSFTDCSHERSVRTSCGCIPGPSSCPTQLSVDLAVFQQCTGCLLWKL